MDIETRAIWPVDLEYRQTGRTLSGRFPYGSTATIASSGRVRKETFRPRAFEYAVNDPGREVNLLSGHTYGQPVASKRAGSLKLKDGDDALEFTATLPAEAEQPSWIRDLVLSVQAGLMRGLSPGFTVPPKSAVANAERLIPETDNPGVYIREIAQAVLFELSIVTRAAYKEAAVDIRADSPLWTPEQAEYHRLLL